MSRQKGYLNGKLLPMRDPADGLPTARETFGCLNFLKYLSAIGALFLALHGLQAAAHPNNQQKVSKKEIIDSTAKETRTPSPHAALPPWKAPVLMESKQVQQAAKHVYHRVQSGDTLAKLFVRFEMPLNERLLWIGAIESHYHPERLQPGMELHFYFAQTHNSGGQSERLKALEIDLNEDTTLAWEMGDDRGIVYRKREKPYAVELKTVSGVVESSLFEDGLKAGLQEDLLSQLADIFTWEIDFEKDIQKGDTFKILFEEKSRDGKEIENSLRILAAELISSGQRFFAFYFEKEDGKGSYYDQDGQTLARAFLRFPLEFTNITSRFSHSRFHPILKIKRPHYGIDFAAKRGTPVRAVSDGVITYAGWKSGGYGRVIEVQHDGTYASRYAHLHRTAKGIRKGVRVKKGQIVGYVGSSGRTTGPHLHFELYKDGEYIDPLNYNFPPEDRIEPALQKLFDNAKQLFMVELASTPQS